MSNFENIISNLLNSDENVSKKTFDSDEPTNTPTPKKDCYDCVHSKCSGGGLKCTQMSGDVSERRNVCSKFADSETTKLCEDCEHYEFGAFSRWNDHGKCTLTGERRRDDDVACRRFEEW